MPVGVNRHVRIARSRASDHGDSPLLISASTTWPAGSMVTSAVTVIVPAAGASEGKGGDTP